MDTLILFDYLGDVVWLHVDGQPTRSERQRQLYERISRGDEGLSRCRAADSLGGDAFGNPVTQGVAIEASCGGGGCVWHATRG